MCLWERVLSKGIKSSLFSSQRIGKVKLFTMWILMSSINAIHKHPFLVQAGLFTPASATLTTGWALSTPSWRTQTPSPACPSTASPPASVLLWPASPAPTWTLMPGEHHTWHITSDIIPCQEEHQQLTYWDCDPSGLSHRLCARWGQWHWVSRWR